MWVRRNVEASHESNEGLAKAKGQQSSAPCASARPGVCRYCYNSNYLACAVASCPPFGDAWLSARPALAFLGFNRFKNSNSKTSKFKPARAGVLAPSECSIWFLCPCSSFGSARVSCPGLRFCTCLARAPPFHRIGRFNAPKFDECRYTLCPPHPLLERRHPKRRLRRPLLSRAVSPSKFLLEARRPASLCGGLRA